VNSNPEVTEPAGCAGKWCPPPSEGEKFGYGHCCENNTDSKENEHLICFDDCQQEICNCKKGYFPNVNKTGCEKRPQKELGEKCNQNDDCYVAFANCINGRCQCKPEFTQVKDLCKPKEYYCPYESPVLHNGSIIPCEFKETKSETEFGEIIHEHCPENSQCLVPVNGGIRYPWTTASGHEFSYCCPSLPGFNVKESDKIFDPVCLYGTPSKANFGWADINIPSDYYWFKGIGVGHVLCPRPCLKHPTAWTIVKDGKCDYTDKKNGLDAEA